MPRFGCRLQKVVSYWVKLQGAELSLPYSPRLFLGFLRPRSWVGGGRGSEAPLHTVNRYQNDMQ